MPVENSSSSSSSTFLFFSFFSTLLLDFQPPVRNTFLLFISQLVCGFVTEVQWIKGGMLSQAFLQGCGAALMLLAVPLPPGLSPTLQWCLLGPAPQDPTWSCSSSQMPGLPAGGRIQYCASLAASQAWPCRQLEPPARGLVLGRVRGGGGQTLRVCQAGLQSHG